MYIHNCNVLTKNSDVIITSYPITLNCQRHHTKSGIIFSQSCQFFQCSTVDRLTLAPPAERLTFFRQQACSRMTSTFFFLPSLTFFYSVSLVVRIASVLALSCSLFSIYVSFPFPSWHHSHFYEEKE